MWRLVVRRPFTLMNSCDAFIVTPVSTPTRLSSSSTARSLLIERIQFPATSKYNQVSSRLLFSSSTHPNTGNDVWTVPKRITIPEDRLEFSFIRSSGAGGQNVNKVNSQVQLRVPLLNEDDNTHWIPWEVRQRLMQQQANRISKEGILTLASQEHRTQIANRAAVVQKLHTLLLQAWPRPKERHMRQGISVKTKQERKEFKRRRGDVKEGRKKVDF